MRHRAALVLVPIISTLAAFSVAPPGDPGAGAPAIVSPEWLAAKIGGPGLAVLDARPALRDYLAGHLPGAQPLGVENVRSAEGGVPGQIFPREVMAVIAGRLGIDRDAQVVVYGAENDPDATFVATALRLAGFPNVSVLDGGLKRWTAEGRPVTADRGSVKTVEARPASAAPALAGLEEVRRAVKDGTTILLDVRPTEQFEAGHLPGAVNRAWKADLVPEGKPGAGSMKDAADLAKEYAALGVTPDQPVVVYCNTGHMASSAFYTLRYRLGYTNVRLYDGSWTEWAMHPDLPEEKGPAAPRAAAAALAAGAPPIPPEALAKARQAADQLTFALRERLMTELAAGGPPNAMKVCANIAQKVAAGFSDAETQVRRVSLKVRNPADTPDPWEKSLLEEFELLHSQGKLPNEYAEVVSEESGRSLRYLRPIFVGQPCLSCHGPRSAMLPEVRQVLEQRYPGDRAWGYQAGDLRGAVSVTTRLD